MTSGDASKHWLWKLIGDGDTLAPGMEIEYAVTDAAKWDVDPERDASEFDAAIKSLCNAYYLQVNTCPNPDSNLGQKARL